MNILARKVSYVAGASGVNFKLVSVVLGIIRYGACSFLGLAWASPVS